MNEEEFGIQLIVHEDSGVPHSVLESAAAYIPRTEIVRATDEHGLPMRAWEVNMVGLTAAGVTRQMEAFAKEVGIDLQKVEAAHA